MMSWLSKSLTNIGKAMGIPKPDLPAWDDADEVWADRCQADVEILATAWHRMMQWCEDNDCGMWRPTGAGMSWSAYRHRFMPRGIQHHGIDELYAKERRATWTGRCEAWQHGRLPRGPFTEWDMTLAYANIAKECALPFAPFGNPITPSLPSVVNASRRMSVLSDIRVSTEVPTIPCLSAGGIYWPTGTFTTTIWDNELKLALSNGATIEVLSAQTYRRWPILRTWGEWITNLLSEEDGITDPIVRTMVKAWARTVIGRFGLKYSDYDRWNRCPLPDLLAFQLVEHDRDDVQRCIALGDHTLVESGQRESPDSCPSVMGWIMAECRVRLWNAMQYIGLENVCYVDTDSIITRDVPDRIRHGLFKKGFRPKAQYESLEVLGPRQLIVSGEIKASGVPSRARTTDGKTWAADVWSSPYAQLSRGVADAVDIRRISGVLAGADKRRVHGPDGRTEAMTVFE